MVRRSLPHTDGLQRPLQRRQTTGHLRTKRRLLSDRVVSQVMQANLIPTTMFDGKRHNGITGMGKRLLQTEKCLTLLFGGKQFDRYGTLHVEKHTSSQIASQQHGSFIDEISGGIQ